MKEFLCVLLVMSVVGAVSTGLGTEYTYYGGKYRDSITVKVFFDEKRFESYCNREMNARYGSEFSQGWYNEGRIDDDEHNANNIPRTGVMIQTEAMLFLLKNDSYVEISHPYGVRMIQTTEPILRHLGRYDEVAVLTQNYMLIGSFFSANGGNVMMHNLDRFRAEHRRLSQPVGWSVTTLAEPCIVIKD